jgi:hypothetical protein
VNKMKTILGSIKLGNLWDQGFRYCARGICVCNNWMSKPAKYVKLQRVCMKICVLYLWY